MEGSESTSISAARCTRLARAATPKEGPEGRKERGVEDINKKTMIVVRSKKGLMEKVFLGVLSGLAEPGLIHVICATLDFIYYAYFKAHTLDSLQKLNEAWVIFHKNL
jgi:hypothetical protein